MPDNEYDKIRKRECTFCKSGIPLTSKPELHVSAFTNGLICTAPSPLAVIDRQAEEIRALRSKIEAAEKLGTAWRIMREKFMNDETTCEEDAEIRELLDDLAALNPTPKEHLNA